MRVLWGDFEVELPKLEFKLFADGDSYLEDFSAKINQLVIEQAKAGSEKRGEEDDESDCYISALGVRHEWSTPCEIGEMMVGPYVNDMDIDTLQSKL